MLLTERGDTVTENVIMAAALFDGETIIRNASPNYMVQDVCFFLEKLGVEINGIGTTTLRIRGKKIINKKMRRRQLSIGIPKSTRREENINEIDVDVDLPIPDDLMLLLCSGVGVYDPSSNLHWKYTQTVLRLAAALERADAFTFVLLRVFAIAR